MLTWWRYMVQDMNGTVQLAAASLLGRLQVQALHGPRVTLALRRLLPPGLVAAIQVSHVCLPVCHGLSAFKGTSCDRQICLSLELDRQIYLNGMQMACLHKLASYDALHLGTIQAGSSLKCLLSVYSPNLAG